MTNTSNESSSEDQKRKDHDDSMSTSGDDSHHKKKVKKHKRKSSKSKRKEKKAEKRKGKKRRKDKDREKCKRKKSKKDKEQKFEDDIGPELPSDFSNCNRNFAPMSKEQWEAKQKEVRRVLDKDSGRYRLVRGDGEIIEEIVSKERHNNINKQATASDGAYFQSVLSKNNSTS